MASCVVLIRRVDAPLLRSWAVCLFAGRWDWRMVFANVCILTRLLR